MTSMRWIAWRVHRHKAAAQLGVFARNVAPLTHRLSPDFSEAPVLFVQKTPVRHQILIDGHDIMGRKGYNGPGVGSRRAI
jgi:hypothetical protein